MAIPPTNDGKPCKPIHDGTTNWKSLPQTLPKSWLRLPGPRNLPDLLFLMRCQSSRISSENPQVPPVWVVYAGLHRIGCYSKAVPTHGPLVGLRWFINSESAVTRHQHMVTWSSRCQPAFWWQMPAECEVYKDEKNMYPPKETHNRREEKQSTSSYMQDKAMSNASWLGTAKIHPKSWWILSYCRFWVSRFRCRKVVY